MLLIDKGADIDKIHLKTDGCPLEGAIKKRLPKVLFRTYFLFRIINVLSSDIRIIKLTLNMLNFIKGIIHLPYPE